MIVEIEIVKRLLLAVLLGGLVGIERERQNQPAGLRTHIILVVGATLAMTLSINLPIMYSGITGAGDPGRLAAQVISGIGFLGAGAILRYGANVRGLTTATSLWTMAVVGLVVGAGQYLVAGAATLLLLIVLSFLNLIENKLIRSYMNLSITLKADDRKGLVKELKEVVAGKGKHLTSFSIKKNLEEQRITVNIDIRTTDNKALDDLVKALSKVEGVRSFEIV
ncbi:MAG: MgtC/SapB family protein [Anaerolineaceae bacterium]|nr:MgtC/SapB family protein [Anaerolineaceae bacterium]